MRSSETVVKPIQCMTQFGINHDMMAYRCNLNCSLTKATNLMYYIKKKVIETQLYTYPDG